MSTAAIQRVLRGLVRIDLEMEVLTGLLIRMPVHAQVYRIGGADLYPIVTRKKYALDSQEVEVDVPMVPGSSLKGRMRGLLELALGKPLYSTDGRIWLHARVFSGDYVMNLSEIENDIVGRCEIDEVFGAPAMGIDQLLDAYTRQLADRSRAWQEVRGKLIPILAITRLLVDDMYPTAEYVKTLSESGRRLVSVADFLEEKGENRIDRVTSAADPRQVVRVRPGVVFGGALRLLVFDVDRGFVGRNLGLVARGLKLVEETYLGASGSRGYGRVRFRRLKVAAARASDPTLRYEVVGEFGSVDELLARVQEVAGRVEQLLFQ
ncbi:MAG: type III-A CRISPR-associated RAMP protein Csm3 [Thermofilum sp.]|nr:type III-A CRISPR-associated RAMP protein Csm3 [Thermofilum sp.]